MPDQSSARVPLAGSEQVRAQAVDKGPVDAGQRAEVTIVLRSRTSDQEFGRSLEAASAQPMNSRQYLSREQLSAVRAADTNDIERIKNFADTHHLTVTRVDGSARTVSLEGTLENLEQAFGVELHNYEADGHTFRAAKGAIQLPSEIAPAVTAVLGLDTRPVAHPR
jgi:kumamolisin